MGSNGKLARPARRGGATNVRVSVAWRSIAPTGSVQPPGFDPTDPACPSRIRYWQVGTSRASRPSCAHSSSRPPGLAALNRRMVNEVARAVKSIRADNLVVADGTAPVRDITPEVQIRGGDPGRLTFMRELLCLSKSLRRPAGGAPGSAFGLIILIRRVAHASRCAAGRRLDRRSARDEAFCTRAFARATSPRAGRSDSG